MKFGSDEGSPPPPPPRPPPAPAGSDSERVQQLTLARRTLVLENKRLTDELEEQKKAIVVLKQKLAKAGAPVK